MPHQIDLTTWKRREHFELFLRSEQPFFSVTGEVDVTALWDHCRRDPQTSFFVGIDLPRPPRDQRHRIVTPAAAWR